MDSTLACLASWMPRQRWYAAKGRTPALSFVGAWDLPSPDSQVRVRTLLVLDETSLPSTLYQVPVVERPTETVAADTPGVIGTPDPGITLVDAPTDPAYTRTLLDLLVRGHRAEGARTLAQGRPAASAPSPGAEHSARVLSGEQSNTSIIYVPDAAGTPVICKIYRQLHAGLNPDIELQTALADAGSAYVPRAIGSIDGTWTDPSGGTALVHGSLAFAQEFLPGVEDAWRVALRAAVDGEDFAAAARALGEATAAVHRDLALLFPTREPTPTDRATIARSWEQRLTTAIAEIPELGSDRAAIAAVYEAALTAEWPALQRVHGDYHLGQVILVPGRGWVLLDFEGEPLRPMRERVLPDLALRDVAGMLRSFDYVAGSIRLDHPDRVAATQWAADARAAFLDGYGGTLPPTLLDALELDKAVYEAIYEARNRPAWVTIPLQAVRRLVGRAH